MFHAAKLLVLSIEDGCLLCSHVQQRCRAVRHVLLHWAHFCWQAWKLAPDGMCLRVACCQAGRHTTAGGTMEAGTKWL